MSAFGNYEVVKVTGIDLDSTVQTFHAPTGKKILGAHFRPVPGGSPVYDSYPSDDGSSWNLRGVQYPPQDATLYLFVAEMGC